MATISSQDRSIGELIAEAFDKVGKDGVISVEEASTTGAGARVHRGHAVRQGLHLAVLRHRRRAHGGRPRGRVPPGRPGQDQLGRGPAAAAGEGRPGEQAAADHRRGRRRRGPVHARREPHPRHLRLRRRQGTGVRRPPQGDPRGHRRADRRPGRVPRGRAQARPGRPRGAGQGAPRRRDQGRHHHRRGRRRLAGRRRPGRPVCARRSSARDSDWDREKLNERLAKLAGGVCVIKVGAHTEVELKEKKHRIEDAVSATRAAIEEGIVAGGGSALIHAASVLSDGLGLTGDQATGVAIVRRAVVEPLRWIAENAGLEGYVVTAKVGELAAGHGLNAATGEYGDLLAAGVIDPVKVTRSALRERRVHRRDAAHDRDAGRGEEGRGRGRRAGPQPRRPRPQPLARELCRQTTTRPRPLRREQAGPRGCRAGVSRRSAAERSEVDQLAVLLAEPAPDAVRLADRQRVRRALRPHRARRADSLRRLVATGPGRSSLTLGVEEQLRAHACGSAPVAASPTDRRWVPGVGRRRPWFPPSTCRPVGRRSWPRGLPGAGSARAGVHIRR